MTKKEVKNLIEILESWITYDHTMIKATKTYKDWQHDKNSYAFGYIQGIRAALQKIYEIY